MKTKLLLLIFLFLIPAAAAATYTGSMKLLAMSELEEGVYRGSIADLALEIMPGKGRVFVNTFPISKLDTQISMRFAKQVACKHTGADCRRYDFIYTIKATSGIVGGPSAGAAAAVLTTSLLSNLPLKEGISITGTINSGELIGPVGGLKEKVDAAPRAGIKKVLVPKGGIKEENETVSVVDYGRELGVEVIEVSTLNEALYHFTGKLAETRKKELVVDPEYSKIMMSLAVMLCNRSSYLQQECLLAKPENDINESFVEYEKSALNATEKSGIAFESGDYYTAASYCFRANIDYRYLWYYMQNLTAEEIMENSSALKSEIDLFEKYIDNKEIRTLTDLQAYMITKERIGESIERIRLASETINNTLTSSYWLAFAEERFYSAFSWSHFFGAEGQLFILDNESLKQSCEIKISEAEERYQYVNFYFPTRIPETRREIDDANNDMREGNYIMCLYRASRAKSQANVILGVIGVDSSMIRDILLQKLDAAEQTIVEQQEMGIFPIMGYSYFEYANSLADYDPSSAMIYAEYALELSNFDFYFEKKELFDFSRIDYRILLALIAGACIGLFIGIRLRKSKRLKKKSHLHGIMHTTRSIKIIRAKARKGRKK